MSFNSNKLKNLPLCRVKTAQHFRFWPDYIIANTIKSFLARKWQVCSKKCIIKKLRTHCQGRRKIDNWEGKYSYIMHLPGSGAPAHCGLIFMMSVHYFIEKNRINYYKMYLHIHEYITLICLLFY